MKKSLFTLCVCFAVSCCTLAYAVAGYGATKAAEASLTADSTVVDTLSYGKSIGTVEAQLYSDSGLKLSNFGDAVYVAQLSEGTYMGFKPDSTQVGDDAAGEASIDRFFTLVAIQSSEVSVTIPDSIKIGENTQPVRSINASKNLKNGFKSTLKTLTVPSTINYINRANTFDSYLSEMYMLGDAPTVTSALSVPTVYVCNSSSLPSYLSNDSFAKSEILPYGCDFEWITVNVGRKGEFAQTYIEMTDANWAIGAYVKVTGTLNTTDLENIKKLTKLRKLDLREAEFTSLPSAFLQSKATLWEVFLPDHLTAISSNAFQKCTALYRVIAPGVLSIGNFAFYGCTQLTEFDVAKVQIFGESAFDTCEKFNPTDLSSAQSIARWAFTRTAIQEVEIPESITTISFRAFMDCSQLTKVVLPNTIIKIDEGAFYNCSSLTSINLPNSLTSIASTAFYSCTSLSSINLPNSLTSISYSAFEKCSALTTINLPEGVTSIGASLFNKCSNLSEVVFPSTLQSIGSNIFSGCSSLSSVKVKTIVPPTTDGNFTNGVDLNHCVLYIAPFAIDAYRAAADWSDFYIMKPLMEPVKNIYINRLMSVDLLSEDNAVLQENPNMTLDYHKTRFASANNVGQLTAGGDGTLSAGVFAINHLFWNRDSNRDGRTSLINNAENMRADSVVCTIEFSKNCWHFISFQYDVKVEDIVGLNNTDFVIREYDSAKRASGEGVGSNWIDVPARGTLKAGKGYIIQVANNTTDSVGSTYAAVVRFPSRNSITKNRLFASTDVEVALEEYVAEFAHNRSWNFVGNPYPCYYNMNFLAEEFSSPIILWRGTSYQAYSPVDDDIILRPNEAFFVQRPVDAESMLFGADGRMHNNEAYSFSGKPGIKAPAMISAADRSVFNFYVEGCGSDDRARIVMNEAASADYEINRDASKFFAEAIQGVELYVDEAVKYDICERPLGEGRATLGLRVANDGTYTLSLSGRAIDGWTVMLTDNATGATVNLTREAYTFDARAGKSAGRFAVSFTAPEPSAIEAIEAENGAADVRVVNTLGVVVFDGSLADFKASAAPGVYVVVEADKAYKIVVK